MDTFENELFHPRHAVQVSRGDHHEHNTVHWCRIFSPFRSTHNVQSRPVADLRQRGLATLGSQFINVLSVRRFRSCRAELSLGATAYIGAKPVQRIGYRFCVIEAKVSLLQVVSLNVFLLKPATNPRLQAIAQDRGPHQYHQTPLSPLATALTPLD